MREIRQSGLAGGRDRIAFGPPYPIRVSLRETGSVVSAQFERPDDRIT